MWALTLNFQGAGLINDIRGLGFLVTAGLTPALETSGLDCPHSIQGIGFRV